MAANFSLRSYSCSSLPPLLLPLVLLRGGLWNLQGFKAPAPAPAPAPVLLPVLLPPLLHIRPEADDELPSGTIVLRVLPFGAT